MQVDSLPLPYWIFSLPDQFYLLTGRFPPGGHFFYPTSKPFPPPTVPHHPVSAPLSSLFSKLMVRFFHHCSLLFLCSGPPPLCHLATQLCLSAFTLHWAPLPIQTKVSHVFFSFFSFFFFFCSAMCFVHPFNAHIPYAALTSYHPWLPTFLFFSFLSVFVSIGLLFSIFSFLPSAFCFLFTFYFFLFLLFCFLFFYSVFFSTFLFLHSFLVLAVVLLNKYPNIIVDCNKWKQYNFF